MATSKALMPMMGQGLSDSEQRNLSIDGEGDFSREACPAVALITVSSNR